MRCRLFYFPADVTKRSLLKFKLLFLKHFGEELTDEEVQRKAQHLLEIYRVVFCMPDISEVFDIGIEKNEEN